MLPEDVIPWFLVLSPVVGIFAVILVLLCGGGEERAAEHHGPRGPLAALAEAVLAIEQAQLTRPAAVAVAPAPAAVVELGYFPYSAEGRRASEKLVCAICLDELRQGETCSEVPACRHVFHRDCIKVWMKSKTTCPLRRCAIVARSEPVLGADDMV